jgi:hypothetical protein
MQSGSSRTRPQLVSSKAPAKGAPLHPPSATQRPNALQPSAHPPPLFPSNPTHLSATSPTRSHTAQCGTVPPTPSLRARLRCVRPPAHARWAGVRTHLRLAQARLKCLERRLRRLRADLTKDCEFGLAEKCGGDGERLRARRRRTLGSGMLRLMTRSHERRLRRLGTDLTNHFEFGLAEKCGGDGRRIRNTWEKTRGSGTVPSWRTGTALGTRSQIAKTPNAFELAIKNPHRD